MARPYSHFSLLVSTRVCVCVCVCVCVRTYQVGGLHGEAARGDGTSHPQLLIGRLWVLVQGAVFGGWGFEFVI